MSIQIRCLSHALGAEISGIDISKSVDDKSFAPIHAAFLEHGILLFRGQSLTREQHIAFSRWFGELDKQDAHRVNHMDPAYPELYFVTNKPKPDGSSTDEKFNDQFIATSYQGADWHTDRSYKLTPSMATLLRGVELPEIGGDTMFANCYRAYDTLSEGMKKLIDGLYGAHIQEGRSLDHSSPEKLEESKRRNRTAQPLVRVHPETGRKALYLGYRIRHIIGMTAEESAPLLRTLHEHATHPQLVYRHVWQKHDLIIWDNRCTMHIALGDFDRAHQLRHMEKTYVLGTPSGYAIPL